MADNDDDKKDNPPTDQDAPATDTATHPETANPAPESTPPPVNTSAGADVVDQLNSRLSSLEQTVSALIQPQDTSPVRKPWTHRSFFGGRS
jgi:hypothetical protein